MLNKFALMLAVGLAIAVTSVDARAVPASPVAPVASANRGSDVTLVAQGCGRGWHWSTRWRRCVRNR